MGGLGLIPKSTVGILCNGVVKDESNDTLAGVDDAHKVVLCTRRHFFCKKFVLLRLKKNIFKNASQEKAQV